MERVLVLAGSAEREPQVVLIGGCSQSGKTWLANRLATGVKAAGWDALVVGLDAWIVSIEKRRPHSSVLERYDCAAIIREFSELLRGRPIRPPVYDPVSRRRICERGEPPLRIGSGVLLAEGVIALALPELRRSSKLNIFVTVPDGVRRARLRRLYRHVKGLDERTAESIISARELEEVALIAQTRALADVVFLGSAA